MRLIRQTFYGILRPSYRISTHLARYQTQEAYEPKLVLTSNCVQKLKDISPENGFLRVLVDSGGCSGFQYKFELTNEIAEDDKIVEQDGVKLIVDNVSLDLMKGSTLDYQDELIRSGFRIQNNPQADKGCSCGVSFTLKLD